MTSHNDAGLMLMARVIKSVLCQNIDLQGTKGRERSVIKHSSNCQWTYYTMTFTEKNITRAFAIESGKWTLMGSNGKHRITGEGFCR